MPHSRPPGPDPVDPAADGRVPVDGAPDDQDPSASDPPAPSRVARMARIFLGILLLGLFLVGAAIFTRLLPGLPGLRLTEDEIAERATMALHREAAESFLITGRLEVTAQTRVENTRRLFPGALDFSLGTTSARVRVPGRIFYGIDVAGLERDAFRLVGDSVLEVTLPPARIGAVEPLLSELEVETEVGWARLYSRSGRDVEHRAIELVERALREQGAAHLADSEQPVVNTARAVAGLLRPLLLEAGMEAPAVRVRVGSTVVRVGPD